jgi:hypothetical protein
MHAARTRKGARSALVALVISGLALIGAGSAMAYPAGPYQYCPVGLSTFDSCFKSDITGGSFTIKSTTVPINKPQVLQGGWLEHDDFNTLDVIGARDQKTMTGDGLDVPGGLLGIVDASALPLVGGILNGITGVTAKTVLVGPNTPGQKTNVIMRLNSLLSDDGIAVELPIKIKLDNPTLGSNCYIGSNSNPILLKLTEAATTPPPPNQSIRGTVPELSFEDSPVGTQTVSTLLASGAVLVDNSFSVPTAHGCGLLGLLDPAINLKMGLPSAAGNNTAIMNSDLRSTAAADVLTAEANQ